ncbi:MAG: hypothetical protein ACI88A_000815, partial [Paraglaciecola sp.]
MVTNVMFNRIAQTIQHRGPVMRAHTTARLFYKQLALTLICGLVLPAVSAQETSGHVVGVQPYPFDTVDPREKE